jgi:hypothetical protein
MKSKEQVIHDYWMEEYHHNMRKRDQRNQLKEEQEELAKPQYTIGIVNERGQLEIVQAKPVAPTLRLLPEVFSFVLFFLITFALMETFIGVYQ